jgi:2-polyprenyl-6-methoxyphenol hydroxylase-like FAD-dependent oxidoreductase
MGDAAHVIHPLAGQGLNLGFGDARSLARVLIERGPGRDIGERVVLRRYERERAEAVWAMGQLTDQLQGLFASQNPALRRLRASGLTLVDHLPIVKQQLMRHAMS